MFHLILLGWSFAVDKSEPLNFDHFSVGYKRQTWSRSLKSYHNCSVITGKCGFLQLSATLSLWCSYFTQSKKLFFKVFTYCIMYFCVADILGLETWPFNTKTCLYCLSQRRLSFISRMFIHVLEHAASLMVNVLYAFSAHFWQSSFLLQEFKSSNSFSLWAAKNMQIIEW